MLSRHAGGFTVLPHEDGSTSLFCSYFFPASITHHGPWRYRQATYFDRQLLPVILAFLIAVAALVVSILSLTLQKKYPERYILRGFGITGIVISCIIIVLLLLTLFASGAI